jgi:hypothetical protein
MGQGTLVEMQIDGGKALVESLRDTGLDVTVSGWTKSSEEGDWSLYIASKDVDDRGLADAYRTVYTTIQAHPEFGIDPFEVKLVGQQSPIAKDLLDIRGAGGARLATRSRRPKLGHMSVEETYVYAP